MKSLWKILQELLFPRFCVGCSKPFTYLCQNCYEQIHFFTLPITLKLDDISLDQLLSCAHYGFPISNLIKEMKYSHVKGLATFAGQLIDYTMNLPTVDLITSVPLHPKRQKDRGFNQAEMMAQEVSRQQDIPYLNLLIRTRHTVNQASLHDKEKRLSNLKDIFELDQKIELQLIKDKSIMIIDDVTTTGTTLNECAKVLKKYGAKTVIGVTLAHGS